MKPEKDFGEMGDDEFREYLQDVASGYAYDPDNKVLDKDKNTTFNDFFKEANAEMDVMEFKDCEEFAAFVSRIKRICDYSYLAFMKISDRMDEEYLRRFGTKNKEF